MRVEVVTTWYNEEFLAPFFLNHYGCWVDRITVLLDSDTNDRTLELLEAFPTVEVRPFTFPDGMDDTLKVERINRFVATADCDWLISVDADEFVWPGPGIGPREALVWTNIVGHNLVRANLFQVYRHRTDKDLDPAAPAVYQRCHGDPDMQDPFNQEYIKPIIVKPETGIQWNVGCHYYMPNPAIRECPLRWFGAHWANADPCFCVERRVKGRRDRMSRHNLENNLTFQNHHVTEEEILELCRRHLDDPRLF